MSELSLSGKGMEGGVVRAGGRGCLRRGEGVESSDHGGGGGSILVKVFEQRRRAQEYSRRRHFCQPDNFEVEARSST